MASAIVSGPSKFDLMISLLDQEGQGRHSVCFVVIDDAGRERRVRVFIWKMEREGMRSSESWVIGGILVANESRRFKATYSTQSRKGQVELE